MQVCHIDFVTEYFNSPVRVLAIDKARDGDFCRQASFSSGLACKSSMKGLVTGLTSFAGMTYFREASCPSSYG
jgi:hypothetical protein